MSENKENTTRSVDVRPKTNRSRSADRRDGYAWSGKKRSWSNKNESFSDAEVLETVGKPGSPLPRRERKHSSLTIDLAVEHSCGRKLSNRSLRQKLQDAMGQCFPIKAPGSRHAAVFTSKRKVHIGELTLHKCPFPRKSEMAFRWHWVKRHTFPLDQKCEQWVNSEMSPGENLGDQLGDWRMSVAGDSPPRVVVETPGYRSSKLANGVNMESRSSREGIDLDCDEAFIFCTNVRKRNKSELEVDEESCPPESSLYHTQTDYIHCLVPDLFQINNNPCYWGVMRDSAQEDYLFSVSFRRYSRSLHARIEQWNHNFSFDAHDPCVFHAPNVTELLEHYKDPNSCMFFEPLLSIPLNRTFPFSLQQICRTVICKNITYNGIESLLIPFSLKVFLKEYHYKQKVRIRVIDA
uniref:Suppressor of cytokine signaling 4 n=1 Tax=Latimeria chalumnae TaxID=7897 RepID=H3BIG0_LATCH